MVIPANLKTILNYFDCQECICFKKSLCYNQGRRGIKTLHAVRRIPYTDKHFNLNSIYERRSKFN